MAYRPLQKWVDEHNKGKGIIWKFLVDIIDDALDFLFSLSSTNEGKVKKSITTDDDGKAQLVNDLSDAEILPNLVYGTDSNGTRGYKIDKGGYIGTKQVDETGLNNNYILYYDEISGKWKVKRLTSSQSGSTWQEMVKDMLSDPPGNPSADDRYIVKPTGTGVWSGHDNAIAIYNGNVWEFENAIESMAVYVDSENSFYYFDGTNWVKWAMGVGDVIGPESSVNNSIAVFDGTTGKIIKDGGKKISDLISADETIDEKIMTLEWQVPVLNIQDAPPENPVIGDRYLIGTSGSGDWSGKSNYITYYNGTNWVFVAPREGMVAYNKNDTFFYRYKSSAWSKIEEGGGGGGGEGSQQILQPLWYLIY